MERPLERAALFAALLGIFLSPRPAGAWSGNGHEAVGQIAEDRLTPGTLKKIQAILGPNIGLAMIAPCADQIRAVDCVTGVARTPALGGTVACGGLKLVDNPASEPWHFVNIPITDSPMDASGLTPYCGGGNCVVSQIQADIATLKDASATQSQKQTALMFLVHFVGDEHQPLHCAAEIVNGVNDRGGNLKTVTMAGVTAAYSLNLHALWDHMVQPTDNTDYKALAPKLEKDLQGKDVSGWTSGDFVTQAALESFQLAKTQIYPAYHAPNGSTITPAYQSTMWPAAYERIERGGVRLAALLERIFGTPPASPPHP